MAKDRWRYHGQGYYSSGHSLPENHLQMSENQGVTERFHKLTRPNCILSLPGVDGWSSGRSKLSSSPGATSTHLPKPRPLKL
ncbi:MAG TPA: hypothetical protein IGS52_02280 [Oscillatoriaceae cyanobacterium M33_DOE_052]|uniref:Uncharacterized protein n=1 Tax=Planktothricoides sp. SpSt-374 TaxID=2282167 RepID=A0A7C3ZKU9_9CYAN|nr:hypothetical protein [Oscillatoriaceae cyanobacterium M33_DOE_052]